MEVLSHSSLNFEAYRNVLSFKQKEWLQFLKWQFLQISNWLPFHGAFL